MGERNQEFNDSSRDNPSRRMLVRTGMHTAEQVFESWAQGDPFIPKNISQLATRPEFFENALENIDKFARFTSNAHAMELCRSVAVKSVHHTKFYDSLLEKIIVFATACKNSGLSMEKANNILFDVYKLSPHSLRIRAHAEALIPTYGEYAEMLSNYKLQEMVESGTNLYKERAFRDDAPPDVRPYPYCLRND